MKGRSDLTTNILASMAYKAKSRVSTQNALRWLHVDYYVSYSKIRWLLQNVIQYGEKKVLDELAKEWYNSSIGSELSFYWI
jgi:glycerol kinase